MTQCCKLYSLICDPDGKMWIFGFSLGVCSMELRNLVPSLQYLVSNGRQVLLGGVRLGSFTTSAPAPAAAIVQQQGALSVPAPTARSEMVEQQITLQFFP